ncbi:TPA: FAD-dependent thymidylate synthase [Acinetobacter baumannii]|uniref:FAD-dependent thymidylate synthase n=1 Tax=Acinetobacter baumannii TaxID=470 RepID=UPI00338EE33D
MNKQFAEYVDHMGNDNSVVTAARVSFDKVAEMFSDAENEALIRFLARGRSSKDYKQLVGTIAIGVGSVEEAEDILGQIAATATHWTPFAHTAVTLRMKAPVPIRTQCFKHKQGMVENEESRRYISSRPELYIPDDFRLKPEGSIKQGSHGIHPDSDKWLEIYKVRCESAINEYERMIADGVCPEQARFILPQGVMVNWIWTGNLFAFANFYNKRSDSHAQKEVQDLAHVVQDIVRPLFPVSWDALTFN